MIDVFHLLIAKFIFVIVKHHIIMQLNQLFIVNIRIVCGTRYALRLISGRLPLEDSVHVLTERIGRIHVRIIRLEQPERLEEVIPRIVQLPLGLPHIKIVL